MGYSFAGLILAPLLLFKGKRVRRRVPRLPKPAGPRSGTSGVGPVFRILFLGDSAAASVGVEQPQATLIASVVNALAEQFEVHWQVMAKTDATTADTVRALKARDIGEVDVAICVLGVNDISSGTTLDKWRASQNEYDSIGRNACSGFCYIAAGQTACERYRFSKPIR